MTNEERSEKKDNKYSAERKRKRKAITDLLFGRIAEDADPRHWAIRDMLFDLLVHVEGEPNVEAAHRRTLRALNGVSTKDASRYVEREIERLIELNDPQLLALAECARMLTQPKHFVATLEFDGVIESRVNAARRMIGDAIDHPNSIMRESVFQVIIDKLVASGAIDRVLAEEVREQARAKRAAYDARIKAEAEARAEAERLEAEAREAEARAEAERKAAAGNATIGDTESAKKLASMAGRLPDSNAAEAK